jgi:hypothetical protein
VRSCIKSAYRRVGVAVRQHHQPLFGVATAHTRQRADGGEPHGRFAVFERLHQQLGSHRVLHATERLGDGAAHAGLCVMEAAPDRFDVSLAQLHERHDRGFAPRRVRRQVDQRADGFGGRQAGERGDGRLRDRRVRVRRRHPLQRLGDAFAAALAEGFDSFEPSGLIGRT